LFAGLSGVLNELSSVTISFITFDYKEKNILTITLYSFIGIDRVASLGLRTVVLHCNMDNKINEEIVSGKLFFTSQFDFLFL